VASEIWPKEDVGENDSDKEEAAGLSLEQQVANEVSAMKRPRAENPQHRFGKVYLSLDEPLIASRSFSQLSNKYPVWWVLNMCCTSLSED